MSSNQPSPESNPSPGIRFTGGLKKQPNPVVSSTETTQRIWTSAKSRSMKSEPLLEPKRALLGSLPQWMSGLAFGLEQSLDPGTMRTPKRLYVRHQNSQIHNEFLSLPPMDINFMSALFASALENASMYAQIIKTRRNDHVTKVDRRMITGDKRDFEKALLNSEDSDTLNTSFIERLNLTIRQSTSFLTRRTTCFARFEEFLEKQLDILRCHYNFLRPHRALKFGPEIRTPAMQAGLATLRFTFRDVFTFLISIIWMGKLDSIPQSTTDLSGFPAPINS